MCNKLILIKNPLKPLNRLIYIYISVLRRYRESGTSEWKMIPVTPSGSTTVTINSLTPGTLYEFQVIGKNALGDGMLSKLITIRTLGKRPFNFRVKRAVAISLVTFRNPPFRCNRCCD